MTRVSRTDGPRARRLVVFLASLSVALLLAIGVLLWRPIGLGHSRGSQMALNDPSIREQVVERLLSQNPAVFDSHPDPAVARVLAPNIETRTRHVTITSNEWGMREASYELPKPAGVLRIVLLGDSFVFGAGVEAADRLGVFLGSEIERRRRGALDARIEVLHLGIKSWNIIAECTYLRRQLSELAPDLVIHVLVGNDLDDNSGVRGFGVRSDFDPRLPERTDARIYWQRPIQEQGSEKANPLALGLDYESASRLDAASAHIMRLIRELDRRGVPYLALANMPAPAFHALRQRLPELDRKQLAYVDIVRMHDERYSISSSDLHWNRAGHERIARLLYALIQSRALLPRLELPEWPEALEEIERLHDPVVRELAVLTVERPRVPPRLTQQHQVYGGIDADDRVSPYASLTLSPRDGARLLLHGRCFDRPEIDGGRVEVFVDETLVGTFTLQAGVRFEHEWPLPPSLSSREQVAVRFVSDDWIYTGPERRDCRSFSLERVEIR